MRIYVPKHNLKCYADRYWPQKPIQIPNNPNIKFEHTVKKVNRPSLTNDPAALIESMKGISPQQQEEEYSNSAMLTYKMNGTSHDILVVPGDWILVYEDGMVVVKKNEQFTREFDEYTPNLYTSNPAETKPPTV